MKMRRVLVILLLMMSALSFYGYDGWIPMVKNYNSSNYGPGYNTWRIGVSGQWIYFANQGALLEYNGSSWHRYDLNNRSEVRGVMVNEMKKRIWVGGENEFGYYEPDAHGSLRYTCLSDSLSEADRKMMCNVFDFYESGGVVYVRSDYLIVMIAAGEMTLVRSSAKMFSSVLWRGTLYVATDNGLRVLTGNQLLPVIGGDAVSNMRINAMITLKDGILILSATDGLYYYDGTQTVPYPTVADGLFRSGNVCCAALKGDHLAVGTLASGLIVLNLQTSDMEIYDNSSGLQTNLVQSVAFDEVGNLWAGLNVGIDYVMLESPFTWLYRAPHSFGMGYTALLDNDKLYLGTNQSLFYTDYPVQYVDRQAKMYSTDAPMGTAWYLLRYADDILLMHDRGVYSIKDGKSQLAANIDGAWFGMPIDGYRDMLLVGTYTGAWIIHKVDGVWRKYGHIEGIDEPCRYVKQVGKNCIEVFNVRQNTSTVYYLDNTLLNVTRMEKRQEKYIAGQRGNLDRLFPDYDKTISLCLIDSQKMVIPSEQGFIMFDETKMNTGSGRVMIEKMYIQDSTDSVLYTANFAHIKNKYELDYKYNSIRVEYKSIDVYNSQRILFQYRLLNGDRQLKADEGWSVSSARTYCTFSNLDEGDYVFEVRSLLNDRIMGTDKVEFRVLPPWYRTWPAYLLFILAAVFGIYVFFRFENMRFERKKSQALEEKNAEVSQMKVEIDKLEKDKMELDLRHKSQEIANLMVNIARKNEILTEIKTDIKRVANRTGTDDAKESKRQLILINNKIDSNMEGDEVLRRFEEEFDLLNDHFMQRLRKQYPDLNNNERMICAYLKMGLSTKEIAPLVNISIRGVETVRYRLRKKFGLERENGLMDFINNFH